MPVNPVIATEALARGLKTEFVGTYKRRITNSAPKVAMCMEMNIPSDKAVELFAYFESAPHAKRWVRGEDRARENFRARSFEVTNHDWSAAVDWHENDEQDDQSRSLVQQARDAGTSFALLPERVLFQVILAATDLDLLPAVQNAPDGAAMFAATDGAGNARFGLSGGNTMAGSGLDPASLVRDLFSVQSRFTRFLDTKGQPLLQPEVLDEFVVLYGAHNQEYFAKAFLQSHHAGEAGARGGFSNVIQEAGIKIHLWPTPRITTNNWFVRPVKVDHKSCFWQVRQPLRDNIEDFSNSDRTRNTKVKALLWDARHGFGLALPYDWHRVTNS